MTTIRQIRKALDDLSEAVVTISSKQNYLTNFDESLELIKNNCLSAMGVLSSIVEEIDNMPIQVNVEA